VTRVAIYCRISSDPEGRELGVQGQEADCRARAEREGWTVARVFTDNDRGASSYSRKPRPAYAEMLRAAEKHEFKVILSYSNSRLTRRPMELEGLIQLHDRTGVLLRTVASGDADLSRADSQRPLCSTRRSPPRSPPPTRTSPRTAGLPVWC
jgi:site-specific DNA recombinase